jgi:hypothetical protein
VLLRFNAPGNSLREDAGVLPATLHLGLPPRTSWAVVQMCVLISVGGYG